MAFGGFGINFIKKLGVVFALVIALLIVTAPAASQQSGVLAENCQPLDLIIILDQSDSMDISDRQAQRVDAVNNLVERLFENAALRCMGIEHRVGVIDFGSEAQVRVPLTSISYISTDDLARRLREDSAGLRSQINAVNNLHQTRFLPAFQLATRMMSDAEVPSSDAQYATPRRTAIITVTDGGPCVRKFDSANEDCGSSTWVEHYFFANRGAVLSAAHPGLDDPIDNYEQYGFDSANGLVNALDALVPPDTILHTLTFSSAPIFSQINDGWAQITERFNGQYFPPETIEDPAAITSILDDLMDELLGVVNNEIGCDQPFYVEPYQGSALILSASREGESRITIVSPHGDIPPTNRMFGSTQVDYVALQTVERYLLINPEPGQWHITGTDDVCSEMTADFETITVQSRVELSPSNVMVEHREPYTIDADNHYVEIEVLDRLGRPFAEIPGYPLNLCGRVQGPSDVQAQLDALPCIEFEHLQAEGRSGIWRSTTPVPAPAQGYYILNITAATNSINPADSDGVIELFDLSTTYETAEPVAIALNVVEPSDGQIIPINQLTTEGAQINQPFPVSVEFLTVDGAVQPVDRVFDVFDLAQQAVSATLYYGGAEIETITLSPADTEAPTQLIGEFRTQVAEAGQPVDMEGDYRIVFSFTTEAASLYNHDNYEVVKQEEVVNVTRRQLRGVQLDLRDPAISDTEMQVPVNRITSDGVAEPETVTVSVALVDQSGVNLPPREVFGTGDNVVFATLYDPSGAPMETIPLSSQGDGLFFGTLRKAAAEIDPPGRYRVRFSIGSGDHEPQLDTSNFSILERYAEISFYRYDLFGVLLENISDQNSSVVPLNTLEEDGTRLTSPIVARAQFTNIDGTVYHSPDELFTSCEGLLTAVLYDDQGNELQRKPMTVGADGVFVADLRATSSDEFDPPGIYYVEIVSDDTLVQPVSERYQLVDVGPQRVELLGREFIGLVLAPLAPTENAVLALNTVQDDGVTPEAVAVSVQLVNQDQKALSAVEALGIQDNKTPVVRATLHQAGIVKGTVDLHLDTGSANTFSGYIPPGDEVGQGGEYSVTFEILDDVTPVACEDRSTCYAWISEKTDPVYFTREEHYGIMIEGAGLPSAVPLNTVSPNGQVPVGFEVRARLQGVGGRQLPLLDQYLTGLDAVSVTLFDAENVQIEGPLLMAYDSVSGDFVATLREGLSELDAPGQYSLVFTLDESMVRTDSPLFQLISSTTVPQKIMRYEVVGVQFKVVTPANGTSIPLNNIESDRVVPEPVEVRIGLFDQSGEPLPIYEVFIPPAAAAENTSGVEEESAADGAEMDTSTESDVAVDETGVMPPALSVTLSDANGLPLETQTLFPSQTEPSVFAGLMRADVEALDRADLYSLSGSLSPDYSLQQGNRRQFVVLSPDVNQVTFRRAEYVGIRMVPDDIPETLPLNSVDVNTQKQIPKPVAVSLRLQRINDQAFITDPEMFLIAPDDTITAIMTDAYGNEFSQAMQMGSDGVFRAWLGSDSDATGNDDPSLDPSGTYTVRYEFKNGAIAEDQTYQIVDALTSPQTFSRQEITGIQLTLVSPDGDDTTVKSDVYRSWGAALKGDAESVSLVFDLRDTNNARKSPLEILSTPDVSLLLDAVQVYIAAPDEPVDSLGKPIALTFDEESGTLHGEIAGSDSSDFEGRLTCWLDASNFKSGYVNLSEDPHAVRLVRNEVHNPTLARVLVGLLALILIALTVHMGRINLPFGRSGLFSDTVRWEYSRGVARHSDAVSGNFKLRIFPLLRVIGIRRRYSKKITVPGEKSKKKTLTITVKPARVFKRNEFGYLVTARLDNQSLFVNADLSKRHSEIRRDGLIITTEKLSRRANLRQRR